MDRLTAASAVDRALDAPHLNFCLPWRSPVFQGFKCCCFNIIKFSPLFVWLRPSAWPAREAREARPLPGCPTIGYCFSQHCVLKKSWFRYWIFLQIRRNSMTNAICHTLLIFSLNIETRMPFKEWWALSISGTRLQFRMQLWPTDWSVCGVCTAVTLSKVKMEPTALHNLMNLKVDDEHDHPPDGTDTRRCVLIMPISVTDLRKSSDEFNLSVFCNLHRLLCLKGCGPAVKWGWRGWSTEVQPRAQSLSF